MKQTFLLFTFLFASSDLFGAYKIKIAVYKDHSNLMTYISKIPEADYRKNILIEEKNNLHYVTSTLYESEDEVNKALNSYKKVFPDAFITEIAQEIILSAPTEAPVQTSDPQSTEPIEKEQVNALEAKILLENKTVYICNEDGSKKAQKEVIRLDFKKEYVLYSKLSRDVPPIEIPYTFDQDCVILPISGIDFKYKIYQEGHEFLSAQSFVNGKEGNHFRYYFDEDLAFKFTRRY